MDVVLGYIDPDYFLGGKLPLYADLAREAVEEHVAGPLGLALEPGAWVARRLLDLKMRDAILEQLAAEGRAIADYTLLAFGGAGPTHVAGYAAGLGVRDVVIPPFASVFSAFGAAMADYEHHYSHASNLRVPTEDDGSFAATCTAVNAIWSELETRATEQLAADGRDPSAATFEFQAMLRFGGQLEDLVVAAPVRRLDTAADLEALLEAFRTQYVRRFGAGALFTGSGYEIFELGLRAAMPMPKPVLPERPARDGRPVALEDRSRSCWFDEGWVQADVVAYDSFFAGDAVAGPAIIEDPKTTIVVPPGATATMTADMSIWLRGLPDQW